MNEESMISKRKLSYKAWFQRLIVPAIAIIALGAFLVYRGVTDPTTRNGISYAESGSADYKVYLKDNDTYQTKVLDKDMSYIADIINTVNVRYKYEVHADDALNYDYNYKVTATLFITDPRQNNKAVYTQDFPLIRETSKTANEKSFSIDEELDIDYDYYNEQVNTFKQQYGVSVDSYLMVSMQVAATGSHQKVSEPFSSSKRIEVKIPLSEQTIDIKIDSEDIAASGVLATSDATVIGDNPVILGGILVIIPGAIMLILALSLCIYSFTRKSDYEKVVGKYLKEYDRAIVNSSAVAIDENNYEVILVEDFHELLDLHDSTNEAILFYEVAPGVEAHFVVVKDNLLYKLIINDAWLAEQ